MIKQYTGSIPGATYTFPFQFTTPPTPVIVSIECDQNGEPLANGVVNVQNIVTNSMPGAGSPTT